jgi:hypothetical protein
MDKYIFRPSTNFIRSSMNFAITLTLLNEGVILYTTSYPVPIDLAMLSNTIPPNSTKLLHCWCVVEAVSPGNIRTRHVCGEDANSSQGISTSAIQEFDPVAMTVKTRSGKTYTLVGPPNNSHLGAAAWRKWSKDNAIVAEVDVTSEYLKVLNVDPGSTVTFKRVGWRPDVAAAC